VVHCGELKVRAFRASGGLLSRVAGWRKAEIEVSFRLGPENTSGWQCGARASWSLQGVGASFLSELIKPRFWHIFLVGVDKSESWSLLLVVGESWKLALRVDVIFKTYYKVFGGFSLLSVST